MTTIQFLRDEAIELRSAMERCDKGSETILTSEFPIMNCKFASLLLAFHYLQKQPLIEVVLVSGVTDNRVSHSWLEVDDLVIDITGDQYNIIDDTDLTIEIIKNRQFPNVHVEATEQSYLLTLFQRTERLPIKQDLSGLNHRFVSKMKRSYLQLGV